MRIYASRGQYYYNSILRCPAGHDQSDYLFCPVSLQDFGASLEGRTGGEDVVSIYANFNTVK